MENQKKQTVLDLFSIIKQIKEPLANLSNFSTTEITLVGMALHSMTYYIMFEENQFVDIDDIFDIIGCFQEALISLLEETNQNRKDKVINEMEKKIDEISTKITLDIAYRSTHLEA